MPANSLTSTGARLPCCKTGVVPTVAWNRLTRYILLFRDLTPRPRTTQRDELKETIASLRSQYTVLQEQVRVDRERVREQEQEIARLQRNAKMAEQAATTALRQAEADHDRQSAALRREKQSLETERRLLQAVSGSVKCRSIRTLC